MGKLLPILLVILGLGFGAGAGLALRPASDAAPAEDTGHGGAIAPELAASDAHASGHGDAPIGGSAFVKMNNQFVIPVVQAGKIMALVVLSLSLEVPAGTTDAIYQREPKLRDGFLQVLFDHANAGGFDGTFTSGPKMETLRMALFEVAKSLIGDNVKSVLVTDLARQDL